MPKHKKFVKSEKSKVKLKGAKLPKGLNVTKTDFKVKKIVIREQIRNTFNSDGTSTRNEDVTELVAKLRNKNTSNRNELLRYLKEIIIQSPAEVSKHFGVIVKCIADTCVDEEKNVRHESFKALSTLLSSTTSDTIAPFFNVLIVYLRSAMTSLNINIREDSLVMLDHLLLYASELVAVNSNKIFSDFLSLISKFKVDTKPERTLSINLSSKLTSVKWRGNVLNRLLSMLKAMVGAKRRGKKLVSDSEVTSMLVLKTETNASSCQTVYFNEMAPMYLPIVRSNLNRNCPLPVVFNKKSTDPEQLDEPASIKKYAEDVINLIFQMWTEVRPSGSEIEISNSAAYMLKNSLEIIDKIHELITLCCKEENNDQLGIWLRDRFNKEFCSYFLTSLFPYKQGEGFSLNNKRNSKGAPTERDVHESGGSRCYHQNLYISILFCYFNRSINRSCVNQAEKIISFLKKNLTSFESATVEVSSLLVKLLREILIENGENWGKTVSNIKSLLRNVIQSYQNNRFSKDIRTRILILLCDIVLNWKLCRVYGEHAFAAWLPTLPTMLCQSYISQHVLTTFSVLAKQKNSLFLKNLENLVPSVLENLSKIQVTGIDDLFEGKKMIANLLFWVDKLTISQDLSLSEQNPDIFKYVQQIAALKEQHAINI